MSINMFGITDRSINTVVERVNANSTCYRWRIPDFKKIEKSAGYSIESPFLTAENSKVHWRLQLYPNGKSKTFNNHLTVDVEYLTEIDNLKATFELSIENIDKNVIEGIKVRKELNLLLDRTRLFDALVSLLRPAGGYGLGVSRSDVENSTNRMLSENCFTISFDVTYNDPLVVMSISRSNERLREFNDYGKLLENDEFSDVTFAVGDKKIRAHKAILAMRSPVFHATFTSDMQEKRQNVVTIIDIDYEVMMELFRFMYTGTVREIEKVAYDLLIAADKYGVELLKSFCEKTLLGKLKIDNVVAYLAVADACNANDLRERAFQFIVNDIHTIIDRDEFTLLNSTLMRDIMRSVIQIVRIH